MTTNTEMIERLRGFEQDHKPDGWPAIQMRAVTAFLDIVEAQAKQIKDLEAQLEAVGAGGVQRMATKTAQQPAPETSAQNEVYLVATGQTASDGKTELYERHENFIPLADCEVLYTTSRAALQQEVQAMKPPAPKIENGGWLRDGSLIYRLSEGGNVDEINVTMAAGSRSERIREERAKIILSLLTQSQDDALLQAQAKQIEALTDQLARCRDAFLPTADSELEEIWQSAISDPLRVAAYIHAAAKKLQADAERLQNEAFRVQLIDSARKQGVAE